MNSSLSITKKTREVGTSAGVLLPRSWLNKQVVITLLKPSKEKILQDVTTCLSNHNLNEEVKGIYLFGSYAREDYDSNSDIDILIITSNTNKLINYINYEILLVSESSFLKNLDKNLNYISITKEAKPILNRELLDLYKNKKVKLNLKKLLSEINSIFNINKDTINTIKLTNKPVPDGIIYSLILRLRELYLIKCIKLNKTYNKKDFLNIVGEKPYTAYLRIKNNNKELNNLSPNDLKIILEISQKWLKELKD